MDLQHAQAEFELGRLVEAVIEPSSNDNGWRVLFVNRDGEQSPLTDQTGTEKSYHTLDNATEVTREVGFISARVEERF